MPLPLPAIKSRTQTKSWWYLGLSKSHLRNRTRNWFFAIKKSHLYSYVLEKRKKTNKPWCVRTTLKQNYFDSGIILNLNSRKYTIPIWAPPRPRSCGFVHSRFSSLHEKCAVTEYGRWSLVPIRCVTNHKCLYFSSPQYEKKKKVIDQGSPNSLPALTF